MKLFKKVFQKFHKQKLFQKSNVVSLRFSKKIKYLVLFGAVVIMIPERIPNEKTIYIEREQDKEVKENFINTYKREDKKTILINYNSAENGKSTSLHKLYELLVNDVEVKKKFWLIAFYDAKETNNKFDLLEEIGKKIPKTRFLFWKNAFKHRIEQSFNFILKYIPEISSAVYLLKNSGIPQIRRTVGVVITKIAMGNCFKLFLI